MPPPADGLPDRYRFERVVGRGGFGVVLRAHDQELDRPVAVKRLLDPVADEDARGRFLREARRTASLRHPHMIQVLDFGEDEAGALYLVYEWVEGTDLAGRRATSAQVREWGAAIAGALEVAHEAGVIHRDVKPANVLLRGDGHVLLADLGIARVAGGATVQTAEGLILGSPPYMAPELFRSEPASPASDQWAWAASLVEMVSGRRVWGTTELPALLAASRTPREFPVPDLPPGLRAALGRALAWDPRDRFASVGDFGAALSSSPSAPPGTPTGSPTPDPATIQVSATPLEASGSATPVRGARPSPPRPSRLPVVVGTGIALALLAAWWGPGPEAPPRPPSPAPPTRGEPQERALRDAAARLLAGHRRAGGSYRHDPEHYDELRTALRTDARLPLTWSRWLTAAQAWLAARHPGWESAHPDGESREAYWEIRRRLLDPLVHLFDDLDFHRGRRNTLEVALQFGAGNLPSDWARDREIQRYVIAMHANLPPPSRGFTRLLLEALIARDASPHTSTPTAAEGGWYPKGLRLATLQRLNAALQAEEGGLGLLELARAASILMRDLRHREVVPAELWQSLLSHLDRSLDARPRPEVHDPSSTRTSKLQIAEQIIRLVRHGTVVLQGPASPESLAIGTRAIQHLADVAAGSGSTAREARRAQRSTLAWLRSRKGDTLQFAGPGLDALTDHLAEAVAASDP